MDAEVVVIGAGCMGASTAKHLAEAGHDVLVVDKEAGPARHQSGHNSGVIHAGYNLTPGSLKARYCVAGSRQMRAYCLERGVTMQELGLIVVAQEEPQLSHLERLASYGRENGVAVRHVDAAEIQELEPHAHGIAALHAPEVASVDAPAYVDALLQDARTAGARVRYGHRVLATHEDAHGVRVQTAEGDLRASVVVAAAGGQADRLAGPLASDLRVVPFRGAYADLVPTARRLVRGHIYGVPDPKLPFLGVHLSRRADGRVTAGPGAMLAFGREAYRFRSVQPKDVGSMVAWPGFWRMFGKAGVARNIPRELSRSLSLRRVWRDAQQLVPALKARDIAWGDAGVRAQMVDRAGNLVEDLVIRETDHQVHLLNAVSPGLTCSLPLGGELARRVATKL